MPRCTRHIYDFYKIPGGSAVELWTEGPAATFDTVALVEADDGRWEISHANLYRPSGPPPPPASFPAITPQLYVVTFFTSFRAAAETEVTLNLRIVAQANQQNPEILRTLLRCTVAGKAGDGEDFRTAFVKTIQS